LRDGRDVAVKVQYPGAADAITADLANADALYALLSTIALRGLDAGAVVAELRARMTEECDYRIEAANQSFFAATYAGHPSIRVPSVVHELSTSRVLVSDWVDGASWAEFVATATPAARQRAAETIFRFGQAGVHRLRRFNGDPHPGNYRFAPDGSITFLDFGLVKRYEPGEWEALAPTLDAVLDAGPDELVAAMERSGFLRPGHALDPQAVWDYVAGPYLPYRLPTFTYTRRWTAETVGRLVDLGGETSGVVRQLSLPAGFVILNRVVWGVSALLGKLGASGPWGAILDEYRLGGPPATPLGEAEAAWRAARQ
jgi:predicted unusual protein kinase regulating ubiquinone biosynthesis (AarF/ABC1/UbiB family)